jgi:DNA-binding HxlR family transcriptional regulator
MMPSFIFALALEVSYQGKQNSRRQAYDEIHPRVEYRLITIRQELVGPVIYLLNCVKTGQKCSEIMHM